ncbi:hypothetical protein Ddye_014677, partial [Dipteronia dyeriana]
MVSFAIEAAVPQVHSAQSNNVTQANLAQNAACFATPYSVNNPAWYADSRATNHMTADMNNLTISS